MDIRHLYFIITYVFISTIGLFFSPTLSARDRKDPEVIGKGKGIYPGRVT